MGSRRVNVGFDSRGDFWDKRGAPNGTVTSQERIDAAARHINPPVESAQVGHPWRQCEGSSTSVLNAYAGKEAQPKEMSALQRGDT
jgi:hypothetical protein